MSEFLTFSTTLQPVSIWVDIIGTLVLAVTLYWLIRYTQATESMKQEVIEQTDISTRPVMFLYVRNTASVQSEHERGSIQAKYALTQQVGAGIAASPYYLALKNVGKGSAFNVSLKSEKFIALRYQTRFFAVEDEHAVSVVLRPNDKIRDIKSLNGEVFTVQCLSAQGNEYHYRYLVKDVEERAVEFVPE